jgi:hypothetical protein
MLIFLTKAASRPKSRASFPGRGKNIRIQTIRPSSQRQNRRKTYADAHRSCEDYRFSSAAFLRGVSHIVSSGSSGEQFSSEVRDPVPRDRASTYTLIQRSLLCYTCLVNFTTDLLCGLESFLLCLLQVAMYTGLRPNSLRDGRIEWQRETGRPSLERLRYCEFIQLFRTGC